MKWARIELRENELGGRDYDYRADGTCGACGGRSGSGREAGWAQIQNTKAETAGLR